MKQMLNLNPFSEALRETLEKSGKTQEQVAKDINIPKQHLSEMKLGKRNCTAEYDLRLSRYFGTSEGFWLRLQVAYQLRIAKAAKGSEIKKEVVPA